MKPDTAPSDLATPLSDRTVVVMADTRNPLVEDYLRAQYWSLAAVINADYAHRMGYDFRYYLLGNAKSPTPQQLAERAASAESSQPPPSWRSRLAYRTDVAFMSALWMLCGRLDPRDRYLRAASKGYTALRNRFEGVAELNPWGGEKQEVFCRHPKWGPRSSPWGKLLAIADLLNLGYGRVVYVDSDAIFVDPRTSVDAFLDRHTTATCDPRTATLTVLDSFPFHETRPNSGFMIWRNTDVARGLLHEWWHHDAGEYHRKHDYEQNTLIHHLLRDDPVSRLPDIRVLESISFIERRDQFVRHIGSSHGWERVPRFRLGLSRIGAAREEYRRRVRAIALDDLIPLNVEDFDQTRMCRAAAPA